MIRSQNFDQIRMGLQTAKDNALNVKGSYAVVGLVSAEAKKSLAPSDEFQPSSANSSAGSLQTDFARKVGFAGEARDTTVQTLQTTLASIDDLGLPAGETRSLKDAINGALAEDRLGVFEQMQLKASLRTVEAAKLQRATDAAKASELRHGRVEGNLNHALDALTSLEMVYGNDEVDVPVAPERSAPTVPQPSSDTISPTAPLTMDSYTSNFSWTSADSAYENPAIPYNAVNTNYSAPVADFGAYGAFSYRSPSSPSKSTSDFNVRELSQAVWGDGYKPQSATDSSVTGPLLPSAGNLMSDFLLERGEFTPKKDDEE